MTETNLFTQLAKAQGEFTSPKRTKEVKGAYSFTYAPLDECLAAVRPALAKHGLFLTQGLVTIEGAEHVRTAVYYGDQCIENHWPLINTQPGAQKHGGAGTFARRYGVCSLLGLAPEDDDDANDADQTGNRVEDRRPPTRNGNTARLGDGAIGNPKVKPLPQAVTKAFKEVYDPETGEIEGVAPQAIAWDEKNVIAWGGRLVAEVTGTRSRKTAEAWIEANADNLLLCEKAAPKVYDRVQANIAQMRERLPWPSPDFIPAAQ